VRLPAEWIPLVAFGLLALGVHSLVAAMARFAIPLVPLWWLAMCVWSREIRGIEIRGT
jgi:hypothetical protein